MKFFHPDARDEIDEELRFHLEERTREYIASGMTPDAARRAAAERFGAVAPVRKTCASLLVSDRAAEDRRTLVKISWLDVKLGLRMLGKYPGLSAVALIGMAVAIAIGAGYFTMIGIALDSTLPVAGGDRVVMIQTRTIAGPDAGDRAGVSPHDFLQWRGTLESVTELGAFREDGRNVIAADGHSYLIQVASMTASGFRLMQAAPMLGRTLLDHDERPGAPRVVVIGFNEWRRHFNSDPHIVGTTVHLDDVVHTIVGVMPDGFAFPVRHQYWVPLELRGRDVDPDGAPSLRVFGRVASGFSVKDARAELAAVGDAMAAAQPQSHANVRPLVLAYTQAVIGVEGPELEFAMRSFQAGVGILLLIVAVNVAVLVYARTATRTGEIVVRTALGASRGRIVSQLFIEALVLSFGAAGIGLTLVGAAFAVLRDYARRSPEMADRAPFWFEPSIRLSPGTVVYVAVLAVLAAVVVGVLPALKATGKNVQARLQQFSARGSGMRLGRTWTAMIVVQVAIAVAVLPAAIYNAQRALRQGVLEASPAAYDMLYGSLELPLEEARQATVNTRFGEDMTRLLQRLEAEPDVSAVTFARDFPGQERSAMFEAESGGALIDAASTQVATNLFEVFGLRLLAGRGFTTADTRAGASSVIVDQVFANELAPGGNVVGRHVRYSRRGRDGGVEFGPWLEIVGVVPAFGRSFTAPASFSPVWPRLYHPAASGDFDPVKLVVRVRNGDAARFAQRFSEVAASVDANLKVQRPTSVIDAWHHDLQAFFMIGIVIAAVTASVLLLSAAGIYSMMSFTVAGRRREIGIRTALGADSRRVLMGIFGRASAQLAAGTAAGLAIAAAIEWASAGEAMGGQGLTLLPTVVVVMFTVGVLAALGPARRGLAVQPTEALRDE